MRNLYRVYQGQTALTRRVSVGFDRVMPPIAQYSDGQAVAAKAERQQAFLARCKDEGLSRGQVEEKARLFPRELVRQFKRGQWPR